MFSESTAQQWPPVPPRRGLAADHRRAGRRPRKSAPCRRCRGQRDRPRRARDASIASIAACRLARGRSRSSLSSLGSETAKGNPFRNTTWEKNIRIASVCEMPKRRRIVSESCLSFLSTLARTTASFTAMAQKWRFRATLSTVVKSRRAQRGWLVWFVRRLSAHVFVRLSNSLLPTLRIPFGVEYGQNDNTFLVLHEEDLVGKPARQSTSRFAMDARPTLRVPDDAAENRINTKQKGSSQPGKSLFIPVESFGHLRLGFRTDDEPTDHCLPRIRSLTISHGEPSSGLR